MSSFVVRLSTSPAATWFIRNVASRVDPWLFRATNGRLTSFGPLAMPMVTIVTTGRKSGEPRPVHLACLEDGDDRFVIASAMGQQRHPAWRYNLEAYPEVEVQAAGDRYRARATMLSDAEGAALWDRLLEVIPQLAVYRTRTDRNIRVFRLSRLEEGVS